MKNIQHDKGSFYILYYSIKNPIPRTKVKPAPSKAVFTLTSWNDRKFGGFGENLVD